VSEDRNSREQKKAQSRRRILDSAREVFFRDGFMQANLDEVAELAGVAKGTLYRYFDSKADLYVGVLAENGGRFTERMRGVVEEGGSPLEQLRRVSHFYLEYWTRHPQYFRIFWAIDNEEVIGDLPRAVIEQVELLWEQSLRVLDDVLRRGIESGELIDCDTWEVSNILWTLATALIRSDSTGTLRKLRRRPLPEIFHDAIEMLVRGLEAPPRA